MAPPGTSDFPASKGLIEHSEQGLAPATRSEVICPFYLGFKCRARSIVLVYYAGITAATDGKDVFDRVCQLIPTIS